MSETTQRPAYRARASLRQALGRTGFGVDRLSPRFRRRLNAGLTVFVYHEVTEQPSEFQRLSRGFTTPEMLERQLRWIGQRFSFIAPTDLPQLGGSGSLPDNAALVTFDDAWAGVFRTGLPILASLNVPALCFVNMATVHGSPDLAAVRRFERVRAAESPTTGTRLDVGAAEDLILHIEHSYGDDPGYRRFQGATASVEDVARTTQSGWRVWLGSHLYHHWDISTVVPDVIKRSAQHNAEALRPYANALPALATPYGRTLGWSPALGAELAAEVIFVATGAQNRSPEARVLDRLELEPEPSREPDWWWSAHRRRLFGRLAS